jgi:hypothetical protein
MRPGIALMKTLFRNLLLPAMCTLAFAVTGPSAAQEEASGIRAVDAADGTSADGVTVTWSGTRSFESYHVFRACSEGGPWFYIGHTERESYSDESAQAGAKYWYAVCGYLYNTPGVLSAADSGYRRIPPPNGYDFNRILDERSVSPEYDEKAEFHKFESLDPVLRPYYMNSLKLNLALYIARGYISRGAITVLRGFDSYMLDTDSRMISLNLSTLPCVITFKSKKLFNLYSAGGQELFDRLLANAVFYCIYEDDKELDGGNGITYMVPRFEAIGLSTGYFRNDRDWKDRTILLGTDDKEYREKIKNAGG